MKNYNNELVSIIMNCYNGEKYLKKSIKSVLNQSHKKWELIFWDNLSNDKSRKIILEFKDKRIKYYKSKKFLKLYEARNQAIKKSKGKFVCFLDTDDWWLKDKLKDQLKIMNENKKIELIFSNFYTYYNKNKKKKLFIKYKIPNGYITQFLLNDYRIGVLTVMLKKKFFNKKKFDDRYNIIGDFDYFINLSLKNYFYFMNKPTAYYRLHEKNYSLNRKEYLKELEIWLKKNSRKLIKLNYSMLNFKLFFFKLTLKKILNLGS